MPNFSLICQDVGNGAPGDTVLFLLSVTDSSGAALAPDSLPVFGVQVNGAADAAVTPAVTSQGTGLYQVAVATPTTYNYNDSVGVLGTVLVSDASYQVIGGFNLSGSTLRYSEHQQVQEDVRVAMEAAPDSTPIAGSPDDLLATIATAVTGDGGLTEVLDGVQQAQSDSNAATAAALAQILALLNAIQAGTSSGAAGLTVAVSASRATVSGVDRITYTLTYADTGAGADASVVRLPLPQGVTFLSASDGGTFASGTVTWPAGTITAGTSGTLTAVVSVP